MTTRYQISVLIFSLAKCLQTKALLSPELLLSKFDNVNGFDVVIVGQNNRTERIAEETLPFSYRMLSLNYLDGFQKRIPCSNFDIERDNCKTPKLFLFGLGTKEEVEKAVTLFSSSKDQHEVADFLYPKNVVMFLLDSSFHMDNKELIELLSSSRELLEHKRFALIHMLERVYVQVYNLFADHWEKAQLPDQEGIPVSDLFPNFGMEVETISILFFIQFRA